MATILKPAFSTCDRMPAAYPLRMASGLMMLNVRCMRLLFPNNSGEGFADCGWGRHHMNPSFWERFHLVGCRALSARDDGSRMAHAASGRRRLTGNKSAHRLLDVGFDVSRRRLLRGPPNFTN